MKLSIVQNHFYNIVFYPDHIMEVLTKIEEQKQILYPLSAKKMVDIIEGATLFDSLNPYDLLLNQIINLMNLLQIKKEKDFQATEKIDLDQTKEFIEDIEKRIFDIKEVIHNINIEKEENNKAIQLLKRLKKENFSLDDLQNLKYMTLRFGKLPLKQKGQLEYYQKENFIYKEISSDNQYIWIVYCAINKEISLIDNIFTSMNFEIIELPEFAHGTIDEAIKELDQEIIAMENYIEDLNSRIERITEENRDVIILYYVKLRNLKTIFDESQYVLHLENKCLIYAYSPYDRKQMSDLFNIEGISVVEVPKNVYCQQGIMAPVITKNNNYIKPFEKLISFKEGDVYDPTVAFSIVLLLSSVLLGDLGLGVLFVLFSIVMKRKWGSIFQRIAVMVMIGGIITGSVFYSFSIYQSLLIMGSLFTRISLFIIIVALTYIVLMIWKEIKRKKNLQKEGYYGDFKTKLS